MSATATTATTLVKKLWDGRSFQRSDDRRGLLAIIIPLIAGIAVTIFVGWLLVFSGVMHLLTLGYSRSRRNLWDCSSVSPTRV